MKLLKMISLSLILLSSTAVYAMPGPVETQCPNCKKYYIVGTGHKCPPKESKKSR